MNANTLTSRSLTRHRDASPESLTTQPPAPQWEPIAPHALFCSLGRAGVTLAAHADALRFKPRPLTPELLAGLRHHKASILAALIDPPLASDEARHTFAERLGIGDSLGMDTTPGAPAWLIALGESMHTDAKESARNLSQGLAPARKPSHNEPIEGR